jgi:type I restriction enzyme S subunit
MRERWEIKKLSDVMFIERGGSPRPIEKYLTNSPDGYNWIKISDATASNKYIYKTKEKITKEGLVKTRMVSEGDFILSNSMSFGRPYIMKTSGCIHDGWLLLRDKKVVDIDTEFLYYLLSSPYLLQQFDRLAVGSTVRNLNIALVSSVHIPVPPLSEQKRIVEMLDEAFTAIDKAKENVEKNLQNAKELFESYLQNVFANKGEGWEEKKLSDVAITFGRGKSKHRPRNDKSLYGGNYAFIQTGDVRNSHKHIVSYSQSYNEKGLAQSKLWPKGTICITIAANIAETGILDFESCFPDSMIGLVVDPFKAEVNYTYYALQYLKAALQLLGKGSAQDNINLGTFENQYFPFPKLPIQKTIADKLDSLFIESKRLDSIYNQKLIVLEQLKKSILQKAFTGELTGKLRSGTTNNNHVVEHTYP